MTETLAPQALEAAETQLVHDQELAHMAALIVEASMRPDLAAVEAHHQEVTGVMSPNRFAANQLRIGEGTVPESSENLYRSVTEHALGDLAVSGIVRGAYSAREMDGANVQANTMGNSTFWTKGETGKKSALGQGFIIEASEKDAAVGWVTADQVKGVWGRDSDGVVKNILPTK